MHFNDWLSRRRIYTPDRVGLTDDTDGRQYTYAELDDRASRVAGHLQGRFDVGRGDRIACLSTNRVEIIDLFFACGKIGAVLVPLNFRLPAAGILELLRDCRPVLFYVGPAYGEAADVAERAGAAEHVLPIDSLREASLGGHDVVVYEADETDVAMVLYTSGTTGRAKGAMISWRQIHWNAVNTTIGLQLTQDDTAFLNMPLYHTGGWHVLLTPLLHLGGRLVLQNGFDAERCNERIGPDGVTILFGVPTMLRMMSEAANFATADFARVRFAICGGEPCPLPLIDTFRKRGVAIRQGYGLTEAGPNCFSLPAEDAERKEGSIGFPNFHIGVRLAKEEGCEVAAGEVGELLMKGPHLFSGYWANREETANTLREGWVHTGDLLTRDEEGYYFVVGRKKEMYVSGGENVYPAQVERILQRHAAIALAAVIAVSHPKWGETGWAFVQLADHTTATESDILDWCRQHLAGYQCPKKIVTMETLPIGHSGKIDKLALRAMCQSF